MGFLKGDSFDFSFFNEYVFFFKGIYYCYYLVVKIEK